MLTKYSLGNLGSWNNHDLIVNKRKWVNDDKNFLDYPKEFNIDRFADKIEEDPLLFLSVENVDKEDEKLKGIGFSDWSDDDLGDSEDDVSGFMESSDDESHGDADSAEQKTELEVAGGDDAILGH